MIYVSQSVVFFGACCGLFESMEYQELFCSESTKNKLKFGDVADGYNLHLMCNGVRVIYYRNYGTLYFEKRKIQDVLLSDNCPVFRKVLK